MPTKMSYTRIIRPKNKIPRFTIKQGTYYTISKNPDGSPKINKTAYRKVLKNVNKG